MTPEKLFHLCGPLAMLGWLLLIFAGRVKAISTYVTGMIIPGLISVLYLVCIVGHWGERRGGFGSLADVYALFGNPWLLLAGWVHYLAFDLVVGSWEVRDAQSNGISHLLVIPCLIATFLFGPIGFLLYLLLRIIALRFKQSPEQTV
jgi:hypothetical protein